MVTFLRDGTEYLINLEFMADCEIVLGTIFIVVFGNWASCQIWQIDIMCSSRNRVLSTLQDQSYEVLSVCLSVFPSGV